MSYTAITSSPRAYQSTSSTALELGSWVEQKTAVGKLVIQKYSIKYAFERVHRWGRLDRTLGHAAGRRGRSAKL